jgi:hypothetical protein
MAELSSSWAMVSCWNFSVEDGNKINAATIAGADGSQPNQSVTSAPAEATGLITETKI